MTFPVPPCTQRSQRTETPQFARSHARGLTLLHDFLEHLEFEGRLEADEIHAALAAKVPPVEPVPVLELVPRLAPRQEVVVAVELSVRGPCSDGMRCNYFGFRICSSPARVQPT